MKTTILTLYAEKLPNKNVRLTRENGEVVCEWDHVYSNCPTRRNKYVTVNCYRWNLVWKTGGDTP